MLLWWKCSRIGLVMSSPTSNALRTHSKGGQNGPAKVEDLLRQQGLHPRPVNVASHISLAGAELCYDIWIPVGEMDQAKEILLASGFQTDLIRE